MWLRNEQAQVLSDKRGLCGEHEEHDEGGAGAGGYRKHVTRTCKDVAAPMSSPRDWATSEVCVASVRNMTKRMKSLGWFVIQYTMLPYTSGNTIYDKMN